MKIEKINCCTSIACVLFLWSGSIVHGGTMGSDAVDPKDAIYLGVFGGGGAVSSAHLSQEGTAFYSEAKGGPLAVNAIGKSNGRSEWIVGGHIGYQWPARLFHHGNPNWTFSPATELEGYYLGGATLHGSDLNNDTARLTEHFFQVTYPMHTGVFLVNGILTINPANFGKFHPYIGAGVGTAVISISGANSMQTAPDEPSINHYNSGTNDTSLVFAAQPKIGVSFNLSQNTTMFVDYRFLYLSASDFTFGSTVYPIHPATSNWDVKIGSQYYNMATIGFQFDL